MSRGVADTEPRYPVGLGEARDDRFTFGLVVDLAEVLCQHGYPEASDVDLVKLQQALYRFLYSEGSGS